MNYKIVIPSYNRSDTLVKKTLSLLIKHNIDSKIVYIFVANQEEYEIYKNVLPNEYKNRLFIGVLGMKNIRNFITNYFEEGEYLMMIDDDITDIFQLHNGSIDNLHEFICNNFEFMNLNSCNLWSVYPVNNPFFMKDKPSIGLIYCMGGFFGVKNIKSLLVSVDNKEDFQRSIQYYKSSPTGNLRLNNFCVGTKGYTGKGGMNSFNRSNEVLLEACNELIKLYPNYCELNLSKKNGKPELKLKKNINQ